MAKVIAVANQKGGVGKSTTVFKSIVHNALRSSFDRMIDGETREWPPKCLAFLYQPQRPKITASTGKIFDAVNSKRHEN